MGLFKLHTKDRIKKLERENLELKMLCNVKDAYFMELMSDGMRHGSSLAAKHMADRKQYLKGK